jgi:glycosyltransferase involved in cell wall biosynthesis
MSLAKGGNRTSLAERRRLLMVTTIDLGVLDGSSLHLLSLARQLTALDYAVTLVCPKPRRVIDPSWIEGIAFRYTANAAALGLPNACNVFGLALAVWRLRPRGTRVYVRSSPATMPLVAIARWAGASRVVVESNGWLPDEIEMLGYPRLLVRIARALQRAEARRADRLRAVTAGLKAVLVDEGVEASKIAVIGNGTDTQRFRPLERARCRQELGIADGPPVLAFVGNLWPAVDLDVVLAAMVRLRQRGQAVRLLIAGDGMLRTQLEAKARSLLGADAAIFLGHLSPQRTNVLLGAANVALAPFHHRRNARIGLSPLKIRDYAAAGRACVATDLGGIDELRGEPWMFLARAGDAESYAEAIAAALAADPSIVARRARAYAEQHFDWSVVAGRVGELIS